ncbi:nuclear transport factor 2 family protein [Pantoea tagorei]
MLISFQSFAAEILSQQYMLKSSDPALEKNKRIVYDFYREVFEGLHMEKASHYLTSEYIQHNPNVASGRDAFIKFFSKRGKPKDIQHEIKAPLIAITAEDDKVILVFNREYRDPKNPDLKYTSTWFDMFRITNGKISEHWDPATLK